MLGKRPGAATGWSMTEATGAAMRDLVASATVFASTVNELMEDRLRALAGGKITFAQLKVLTLLSRAGAPSVSDLASFLGVSAAAASKTVDRLVRAGLVVRTAASDDRRTLELSLTGDGERLLRDYEIDTGRTLTGALDGADAEPARRIAAQLDQLSLLILDAIEGDGACFRCGIHFRDRCLLRDRSGGRTCYLHLGDDRGRRTVREGGDPVPAR